MTRRLTLIVLIDALGYEEAKDPQFLRGLDRPREPVQAVLGYSSSCIPSLLSGRRPSEHGHFSMYRRAGRQGIFDRLRFVLPVFARLGRGDWRMRQWIAASLRRRGVSGYFALYDVPLAWLARFDLCQRRNLFEPGAFDDGPGLVDLLRRSGRRYRVWDWRIPEAQGLRELREEIERGESEYLVYYTAELDSVMHAHGPASPAARETLAHYDRAFSEILTRARARYDEVRMLVFGDHGMAPVQRHEDLWAQLERLPARPGRDYLYFLDSTMARFWFENETARRSVAELLSQQSYGRVLGDEELGDLGALFAQREYGEMIFLVDEGTILVPSFMGKSPVRGMHGYHPEARHSYTTLLTNDHEVAYPRNLMEIFDAMTCGLESGECAGN